MQNSEHDAVVALQARMRGKIAQKTHAKLMQNSEIAVAALRVYMQQKIAQKYAQNSCGH